MARSATGVIIPSTAYPPLRHTWNRIRSWCDKHYEEIGDTLNWPSNDEAIDELEMTIGFTLPAPVRESFLCYDGQELESNLSCQDGIFFGMPLLSVDQVAQEWKFWRSVDDDVETGANPEVKAMMASCPHKWIRAEYSCRGWIPLITDRAGNYIGVDLSPHPSGGGAPGQVIIFGRDFDTKVVVFRGEGEGGWGRFLQSFVEELETGELWSLEEPSSGSDDEEDAIGYESYFSGSGGGAAGRGGADRIGEGSAGFRLAGEYKGWPVLEAWADRSIRYWESQGLAPGKPVGGSATPLGEDNVPSLRMVDENGEALDAEGSTRPRSRRGSSVIHADAETIGEPSHPLANSITAQELADTSSAELLSGHVSSIGESVVPSIDASTTSALGGDTDSGNVTPTNSARRITGMLSPPLPDTKASRKQKMREEGWGSPQINSQPVRRPVRPPPAPAQPLDLPTLEDVKAAHAAALADDGRSHSIQFEDGSGGYGNLGYRDLMGKRGSRKMDSLELEARNSAETAANGGWSAGGGAGQGHGGRYGNDSSAEESAFSGAEAADPLTGRAVSTRAGERVSTSTSATSPRVSADQTQPLASKNVELGEETLKGLNISAANGDAVDMPSLIDARSLPNSPVKKSFGNVQNGVNVPSPLNPAVHGDATEVAAEEEAGQPNKAVEA